MTIIFFVPGIPKGQPRPRAFARRGPGGKFFARVYDAGTAEAWKSQVAAAAKPFIPERPIDGPVSVEITFNFPRPKSHFRTGKHAGELRDDAPHWHTAKPDRDNAEKAVTDCLTMLGFWRDDSQIVDGAVRKTFALCGSSPGCAINIAEL